MPSYNCLRVQERACWPDVPKSWSAPGSEWHGKPWGRKARSRHTSGSPTQLPLACSHRTADARTCRLWGYNSRWRALLRRDPGGSPSALRRPSRWGRPAGCRASQAGSLPRAHARRPANTAGAGVRDRRSLEHRGSALRPRPGPFAGPTRASGRQGRRSVRMGATMVERLVGGGAARGGKHCPRPPLARSQHSRGPMGARLWTASWTLVRTQPIASVAPKQDRA